jgi:DNA polymerase-3 subunit gamma/tau
MSGGALYRKYRSKTFKDVIGQTHITDTLVNSIKNNTFAHAYLLTGPRGVGKTSVARLFAYEVNGLSYTEDKTYSDIIEIDAASNRRIDEIRDLREKISITPSALKYKVYIIDEVHMLTKEAFNALLKTLEEPPEHAIFVLATTDFHKVPDTIASRCVRFAFLPISRSSIKKHLQKIAKQESIDIEDKAIEIIAENSDGSFRDAISLLDQFRNSKKAVTAQYVSNVLGLSPAESIAEIVASLEDSSPKKIVELLDKLRASGSNDMLITKQLIAYLRSCLIGDETTSLQRAEIVGIINNLLQLNNYSDVGTALEITLLSACKNPEGTKKTPEKKTEPAKIEKTSGIKPAENIIPDDLWQSVLDSLKDDNRTLYGVARMAEAKYSGNTLELFFNFPFHFKQMKIERNRMLIEKLVKSKNSQITKISLSVKDSGSKEPIDNISNIFGSAEVLES